MKIFFFANTDWYLYNFRIGLAEAAKSRDADVIMLSPPGPFAPKIQENNFKWICVPMKRGSISPIKEIPSILNLIRIYSKEKPDLAQHFTLKCLIYGTIAAKLSGTPNVVNSITGLGYIFTNKSPKARFLNFIISPILRFILSFKNSYVILQNSDDFEELTKRKIINSDKTILIKGSGVNTDDFCPLKLNFNQTPKVLLATRLIWDKGISDYIKAVKILKQNGVNAEFLLAGNIDSGNPASVSNKDINKWIFEGIIHYLGHVEDMCSLLKKVDIVTLPTTYGEGVPRILIEAAASSVPLIATDVPGCREIVRHNKNGILIPPKDYLALADAINGLINNPEERIRMGKNGRQIAVQEFDEKIVIKKTLCVYQKLLSTI
jgi:glycosyltransferase involved in cell wall biosynthesis